jgi:hypothetical protein
MRDLKWKSVEDCFLCNGSGKITVEIILKRDNDQDDLEGEDLEKCPCCDGVGRIYKTLNP